MQKISYNDNFYLYVNNEWLNNTEIPSDQKRWSNFNILDESNKNKVKELVSNSYKSDNNNFRKVGILYHQGLNVEGRNLNNNNSINIYLDKINNVKNKDEFKKLLYEEFIFKQIKSPLNFFVYSDYNDSSKNILHISSGGLGLPDRNYYFSEDLDKQNIREMYKKFIKRYSSLFNLDIDFNTIFDMEKNLAYYHYTKQQARDPHLRNNPTTFDEFNNEYPNISLSNLFDFFDIKKDGDNKINISNKNYVKYVDKLFETINLDILKVYFKWLFILSIGNYCDMEKEEELFNFYERFLSGTPEMKPLWKRSLSNVSDQLGNLVGKMYVTKYFSLKLKNKVENMVNFIKGELKNRLENNDWMEEETKNKAVKKLTKMNIKIGYPNKWKEYSRLDINENNSFLTNNLNCNSFEVLYNFSEIYKPKDLSKWFMDPHMVNAYYSPSFNEIVFPAGILQPPFFDDNRDMAENFGAIGSVIGHEMTHGFDDQGKKFDSDGNLNVWWTDNDKNKYETKSRNLEQLFSSYKIEGKNLNGKLTLGENIADLGGVSISLSALETYLRKIGITDKEEIDRKKKLFFESYARMWRCKTRKEETLKRVVTDPHSPPIYRVNGILGNINDFYRLYQVTNINSLWIPVEKRTSIW